MVRYPAKPRFDKLDQLLNKTYGEVIAQTEKDRAPVFREAQRAWIKHRDEGSQFYVSGFPEAEKERRLFSFWVMSRRRESRRRLRHGSFNI
jgi:uncharacterized protein YecT (DUF1311 family)